MSASASPLTALGPNPIVIDGGLSTQLEARGHSLNDPLWTARVLIEHPEVVTSAHRDYVDAGAQVLITASYQVSRIGFRSAGLRDAQADAALRASVAAARAAGEVLVAASVGPYGAITHDGAEYRGRYGRSIDELASFHAERLAVLIDAEPDLLAVETIPDADEARALVQVLDAYPEIPAWFTFTASDDAHLWAGQTIEEAVGVLDAHDSIVAIGVNCTAPEHVTPLIGRIATVSTLPIIVYPNAGGVWDAASSTWLAVPPGEMVRRAQEWVDAGAHLVGGCCGTDADAIRAIAQALSTR